MSWVARRGIQVWDGAAFPEPTDAELGEYPYEAVREIQPCGTRAAYDRHNRKGEKACVSCAEANATYRARNR